MATDLVSISNLNSIVHLTTKASLKPSTPNQKFRSIKNVCTDISNLLCYSGEKDFTKNKERLENFLFQLQNNNDKDDTLNTSLVPQSPLNKKLSFFADNIAYNNSSERVPSPVFEMAENEESNVQLLEQNIVVNQVLRRKGRPKIVPSNLDFLIKFKTKLEFDSMPIAKKTRSKSRAK